jgi:hypothetical protein
MRPIVPAFAICILNAMAQPPRPAFEVASIKVCKTDDAAMAAHADEETQPRPSPIPED